MKGLKVVLWVCVAGCLLSCVSAACPWSFYEAMAGFVGVDLPAPAPLLVYAMRLSLAMLGVVALFFILLATDPLKYGGMLPLGAFGLICYGAFCLVGGLWYGLPFAAYGFDMLFGVILGVLILVYRGKAIREEDSGT